MFLHTLADGFSYEPDTLDQAELHSQVLKGAKTKKNAINKINKMHNKIHERTYTDQKIQVKRKSRLNMKKIG